MNAPDILVDWLQANQRLLGCEFARLKQRLGGAGDAAALVVEAQAARAALRVPAAIDQLALASRLSDFERDLLLLCAGVEMDADLARLCEAAGGASFGLALAALEDAHWSALSPEAALRRWRLIELDETAGLTRAPLRIDERILHYLAGVAGFDVRLRSLIRPAAPSGLMAEAHHSLCDTVLAALADDAATSSDAGAVVWLCGDDAAGQADVAANAAAIAGMNLYLLRAQDLPAGPAALDALATLWEREALLGRRALLVACGDEPLPANATRFVELLRALVFVSAAHVQPLERTALRFAIDKPSPPEQRRLWKQALGGAAARADGALDAVASQFRLSARLIHTEGARLAPSIAAGDSPDALLWAACRAAGRRGLDELAQRIDARAGWEALVLPEAQKQTLRQIAAHVRNRLRVHVDWGFAAQGTRGLGIAALFAGESGTGKTLAAEVLANELRFDLYRIDLSAMVSKYIGETEKNLRRVFDSAEDSGAILLFDEADALFGKRSEVKDSHDRYANIEVSYLLQRMEAYRGLAILTTNLKTALDAAFQRRLRFVVTFPFPDPAVREAIWRSVFPPRMPRGEMDYSKLARLSVTGGCIRNIALHAAFCAAELGEPVTMSHLLHAARFEAGKRERPLAEAEIRGWA